MSWFKCSECNPDDDYPVVLYFEDLIIGNVIIGHYDGIKYVVNNLEVGGIKPLYWGKIPPFIYHRGDLFNKIIPIFK